MARATLDIQLRHPRWQGFLLWLWQRGWLPRLVARFVLRFGYIEWREGTGRWHRVPLRKHLTIK